MLVGVGAMVMGRKSFDQNEGDGGWGDDGPAGDIPCFAVTHDKPATSHPPAYTFVTDGVVSATEQAKNAASGEAITLHGATVMQQALPLGLVDGIRVHMIPGCWAAARPCSAGSTRRSPSNAPGCWRPLPRRTWSSGWRDKPQGIAGKAA